MKTRNIVGLALVLAISLSVSLATLEAKAATYITPADDSQQDFHIDKDGNISIHQAKVMQIAGNSFYVRYYVGLAFIRILVKTDNTTRTFRRFGGEITLDQIGAGDILNIEGKIENGADNLSLYASKLVNFSNQKEITGFKGAITGAGETAGSFILKTKTDTITIQTGTTTQIRKGNRIIGTDLVKNGDTVTDVMGTYDRSTKTIEANVVVIYIDKKIFVERNFEGTLKSISSENPATLVVNIENKDYQVILTGKTEILNKSRKNVSIKRYLEGDTVRLYGAIREVEEPIIDAELVRNISLQ